LLQTIRIPKNLLFLSDKLPQPNYEKKPTRKHNNNSFSDDTKNELPDININQKANISKRRNEKKSDNGENNNNKNKENSEEINSNEKQIYTCNESNSEEVKSKNNDNNNDLEPQAIVKKKKRMEKNDRSLDNIINSNIYSNALGSNNIKILKNENLDNSNNSLLRDRSQYDDASLPKKKNRENNNIMMLPNIKNQINYDIK